MNAILKAPIQHLLKFLVFPLSLAIGLSIVVAPSISFLLLALIGALVLMRYPPYIWATVAVLLAVLSRLLVATGFIPAMVNFLHFAFVLGGASIIALQRSIRSADSAVTRYLEFGILAFLFISVISWAINGGEFLKPWFTWLVFSEPFLLIYVLLRDPVVTRIAHRLWRIILGAAFLQVLLGFWQAIRYGIGDSVVGSFVGGGAHTAGAVALSGALIIIARVFHDKRLNRANQLKYLSGLVLLLLVPILSDAKAVFGLFIIGGVYLFIVSARKLNLWRLLGVIAVGLLFVNLAMQLYPDMLSMFRQDIILRAMNFKLIAFDLFSNHAKDIPYAWIIGFGPGNTFSKVALMTSSDYAKPDSPVNLLGLSPSEITKEAVLRYRSTFRTPSVQSSVWQPWFSWIGLLGDFGLLGLSLYAWLWWILWRQAGSSKGWFKYCARSIIFTAVLMGMLYNWLEEPGFILVAALSIAVVLVDEQGNTKFEIAKYRR